MTEEHKNRRMWVLEFFSSFVALGFNWSNKKNYVLEYPSQHFIDWLKFNQLSKRIGFFYAHSLFLFLLKSRISINVAIKDLLGVCI